MKAIDACWIAAGVAMLALAAYELWHPCGMRSFNKDSAAWVDRCLIDKR